MTSLKCKNNTDSRYTRVYSYGYWLNSRVVRHNDFLQLHLSTEEEYGQDWIFSKCIHLAVQHAFPGEAAVIAWFWSLFAIWMPLGSSKNNDCATLPQGPRHVLPLHEMRNYDVVRNFIFDVDNESVTFLLPASYFDGIDQPACSLIIEHPPFFGPSLDLTSKRLISLCGSNVGIAIASSLIKSSEKKKQVTHYH